MPRKIKDKWDNLPTAVQKIASFISAIGVIAGCIFGVLSYVKTMMHETIRQEVAGAEAKLQEISMDTTRLQLLSLMSHDPDNVNSILIVAHKYFVEMHGDWYMTERFKDWAKDHDIDLQDFTFAHD